MNDPSSVALNTVDDVLPALPHMLGFYPANSLVMVTLHHRPTGLAEVGATIRLDLPTADEREQLVAFLAPGPGPLQQIGPDALMLFVITTGTETAQSEELPHKQFISELTEALPAAGMPVLTALWAPEIRPGAEWVSYLDPTLRGTVGDPRTSALGVELTARGNVLFSSREDLCALIAPERDGDTAAEWAVKLNGLGLDDTVTEATADRVATIEAAIAGIAEGEYPDEDSLVRSLHWISDRRVRDALLPTALGEHAAAAENLWTILVRKAPAPVLAEVATMLAVSTYVRGDSVLAHIALDRALQADPDHALAHLFRAVLASALPPSEFAQFLRNYSEESTTSTTELQ